MARIELPKEKIREFCRKWRITEFSLFGSVLREDFGPESDIDVLVSFAPESRWSLFEMVEMQEELKQLVGHEVDLVERKAVESSPNYIRRRHILESAELFDVA